MTYSQGTLACRCNVDIAVSNRVVARNGIGQFIRDCEGAAERTVKKSVQRGMSLSRQFAPEGHKDDPRTVPLRAAMFMNMLSRTSGEWGNFARHALPIEKGAVAHTIPADVHFYWERMGRMWMTPAEYLRRTGFPGADPIHHPGNAAQPYLRPAYEIVMNNIMQVAKQEYPG